MNWIKYDYSTRLNFTYKEVKERGRGGGDRQYRRRGGGIGSKGRGEGDRQ